MSLTKQPSYKRQRDGSTAPCTRDSGHGNVARTLLIDSFPYMPSASQTRPFYALPYEKDSSMTPPLTLTVAKGFFTRGRTFAKITTTLIKHWLQDFMGCAQAPPVNYSRDFWALYRRGLLAWGFSFSVLWV
ncbi:hypothetical protein PGTUg99_010485 [Puccinia graminis f. sp. tritici]|uniref:Uncharacterized protein n=1 Tax=Puccinia graminis f. sp. tritici TaxID=56615 RepID=A0A5B0S024_PUCGR|nr:hypothetical protein PGTUg99_010485 [Puccinia graminis f. sp. tritici]